MPRVQERGMHPDAQTRPDSLGGPDQFEPQPQLVGVREVIGLDVLDALVADLAEVDRRVEGEPGQDRHLGRRVASIDVLGRIGLRVPEPLGLGQRLLERHAGPGHLGQDEVGRAVDDPVHAIDLRAGQRLLEDPDDRDDTRHRALEAQLNAVDPGGLPQLLAVLRQQLLVRGHHVTARLHRPQQVRARGIDAAHQLDDQVRALQDLIERSRAAGHHSGQLGPQTGQSLDPLCVLWQQHGERRPDGAVAEQPDPKYPVRGRHGRPGPRRFRGARRRAPRRPGRRSPAGAARRCSCWPASTRRPR